MASVRDLFDQALAGNPLPRYYTGPGRYITRGEVLPLEGKIWCCHKKDYKIHLDRIKLYDIPVAFNSEGVCFIIEDYKGSYTGYYFSKEEILYTMQQNILSRLS